MRLGTIPGSSLFPSPDLFPAVDEGVSSVVLWPLSGADPIELAITTGTGIFLAKEDNEGLFPIPVFDEEYAESVDTEGALRTRSRPQNPGGSGKVFISAPGDAESFWGYVHQWQQVGEATRRNGGVLIYTPADGVAVAYDLLSFRILTMPQQGILIASELCESTFEYTCRPYGRLQSVNVLSGVSSTLPVVSFDVGDRAYSDVVLADSPTLYWRLGASGTVDSSTGGHNGTAGGGVTVGGVTGALTSDSDTATDFDGVDDRISSSYSPFSDTQVRCYEGWTKRDTGAADMTLLAGDGGSTAPSLKIPSGTMDIRFRVRDSDSGSTSSATWSSVASAIGSWFHWVLLTDLDNDLAQLWINGVNQGPKTGLTQTHSTPGNFKLAAFGSTNTQPLDGKGDEVAIYTTRLKAERIMSHYIAGKSRLAIAGSAPALATLTLTDGESQSRDYVEVGIENDYDPTSPKPAIIDSSDFTTSGFAGTGDTRTRAYNPLSSGDTVVRATLLNVPQALLSFAGSHEGPYRVKARVYGTGLLAAGTGPIYVRLAWRIGADGLFTRKPWVQLRGLESWREVDLGYIDIPSLPMGTQNWEGWIEAYSEATADTLDVDYVELIPADTYAKASVSVSPIATSPDARDDFNGGSGNLDGQALQLGGTWECDGDSTDYFLDDDVVKRNANSDSDWIGRYAVASDPVLSSCILQGNIYWQGDLNDVLVLGGLARYQDTFNWVMFGLFPGLFSSAAVFKRVGGTVTQIGLATSALFNLPSVTFSANFAIDSNGNFRLDGGVRGGGLRTIISGQDDDLATGGALASGQVGIYDEYRGTGSPYRLYDNVVALGAAAAPHTINAGKSLAISPNGALKEPPTGDLWTPVSNFEGSYLKLNPGEVSRLVAKARRFNIDTAADSTINDSLSLSLDVEPRVLLV